MNTAQPRPLSGFSHMKAQMMRSLTRVGFLGVENSDLIFIPGKNPPKSKIRAKIGQKNWTKMPLYKMFTYKHPLIIIAALIYSYIVERQYGWPLEF